jgi:hypothetical protein
VTAWHIMLICAHSIGGSGTQFHMLYGGHQFSGHVMQGYKHCFCIIFATTGFFWGFGGWSVDFEAT